MGGVALLAGFGWSGAAAQPQAPRLQSLESAIESARAFTQPVPVTVRGIVILNHDGLIIEDRTGAAEVESLQADPIAPGDEVEVTGWMTLNPQPVVRRGHLRRLWGGSMPLPLAITPDQAAEEENELSLVQMDAVLAGAVPAGLTGVRLNLAGGHQSFSAVLPSNGMGGEFSGRLLERGATLRITGILLASRGPAGAPGGAFTLQLRTPEDIQLLEPPSWWTRMHVLLVAGAALVLVLICANIYARIAHARYRAVAEERTSIARDIHDTLAQGFAGIALQLEAAEQMMGRDPARAGAYLQEALQLVRHSRDESHLSIDILRSSSRRDRLDDLLAHSIAQIQAASHSSIEHRVTGEPRTLPYNLVNNLFRIGQEAVANAVRHASATRIRVWIAYGRDRLRLEIEDNGRGFDPQNAPGPGDGHFGLTGMLERASAMNSRLQLRSGPQGTVIRVEVAI